MVIWSESVADSVVEPGMRGINFEFKSYHNSWQAVHVNSFNVRCTLVLAVIQRSHKHF